MPRGFGVETCMHDLRTDHRVVGRKKTPYRSNICTSKIRPISWSSSWEAMIYAFVAFPQLSGPNDGLKVKRACEWHFMPAHRGPKTSHGEYGPVGTIGYQHQTNSSLFFDSIICGVHPRIFGSCGGPWWTESVAVGN